MPPHFESVLVFLKISILVALFAWMYMRDLRRGERLWMMGWIAMEMHFGAALVFDFVHFAPALADWLAYSTLLVAAACFFLSVTASFRGFRRWMIFWGFLFVPTVAYWTLMVLGVKARVPYGAIVAWVMFTAGALIRDEWWAAKVACLALIPPVSALALRSSGLGMDFILCAAFLSTAAAYWCYYRRLTPGVLLSCVSFVLLGMVWPAAELCAALGLHIPVDNGVWDVPKFFVAVGMIITLLEEKTDGLEREVAERKRVEQTAVAANQAKSLFLATMSHEIRTPLNGILGMAELALDTPLSAEQRDDIKMVHASAESLLMVINDILDFSKIEAGKLHFESIPFDVRELVVETLRGIGSRAKQKGLALIEDLRGDFPPALLAIRAASDRCW